MAAPHQWNGFIVPTLLDMGIACVLFDARLPANSNSSIGFVVLFFFFFFFFFFSSAWLSHIYRPLERARLLLHVIDSAEDDADERWRTIEAELAAYGAGLDKQPQVIILDEINLRPEPPSFDIEDERILRVLHVSAATSAGLDELRRALFERPAGGGRRAGGDRGRGCRGLPRLQAAARSAGVPCLPHRAGLPRHGYAAPEELEAILRAAGARTGDEVEMGEELLEWE